MPLGDDNWELAGLFESICRTAIREESDEVTSEGLMRSPRSPLECRANSIDSFEAQLAERLNDGARDCG